MGEGGHLLDQIFDETLSRLCGGYVDDEWWKRLLHRGGQAFVAPEFLRKTALQEWLAEGQVQADMKSLVRARFLAAGEDKVEVQARLRSSYSKRTGEDPRLASGPIEVVVAVLSAGFLAGLEPRGAHVAALVQAGTESVHERIDSLEQSFIGQVDQPVASLISGLALEALRPILRKRVFAPEQARQEIRLLGQRFGKEGNLRHASKSAHVEVLRWAARLHATQAETSADATDYRDRIRELDPTADTRIVDAWILVTKGDTDSALRAVRNIATDDGRATLFSLLRHAQGGGVALTWLAEQSGREDPTFLTGLGWYHVAVSLVLSGRWEDALACLANARIHVDDCPALALLGGRLNAAMLLPEPIREDARQTPPYLMDVPTVEGAEADRYRAQALDCFAWVTPRLDSLGLTKEAQDGRLMRLWLLLTDPRREVAEEARREVTMGLQDGPSAVHLLQLVQRFEFPFDPAPANQYLERRKRLGGLEPGETIAEFMLAMTTLSPGERADFIEREEPRFAAVLHRSHLTSRRIEALAQSEQFARAKALLEERKVDLSEHEAERLRTLIDVHAGVDVRTRSEELYRQSGHLVDLHNLINVLGQSRDWAALRPRLEDLFRLERTLENAERLVRCLQQMPNAEEATLLAFLVENPDLVARSHGLAEAQAWSLFRLGRWQEAETINMHLLQERGAASDLLLDTNLALQTGNWERFAVIVDREWPRRTEHDPGTLLRLAMLAAESDGTAGRAMKLAELAAEGSPSDPNVLVNASSLAFQLGREEEADPRWMVRAAGFSSDAGPVWRVDLRKMVEEMIPAHRERSENVERDLVRGEIPLHFAAAALNVPLSNILLDLPRRNTAEPDGRRRAVIPVFSGARNPVDVQPGWILGLDVTSILVLSHLGLLSQTIAAVHRVALAPDTMTFLLGERRRARFHQPSRVKKAEEIRSQIDRGQLRVAAPDLEPPSWLVEEVGKDLAQLLEAARTGGGRVVHPLPIYKLRSFQEKEAELREYAVVVLTTVAFARILHEQGRVDAVAHERSRGYLHANDRDQEEELGTGVLACPLYLDDLALIYLQDAGLLQSICQCDLDLRVHPSTRAQQDALIEANREGERLAASLEAIRQTLRDAVTSGKAVFLPHGHTRLDDDHEENWLTVPTLRTFLEDTAPCDAICIDDRFLNRNPILTDRRGRVVPVLCTLDLLGFLETQGVITAEGREEKLHHLRKGCFGLVPVSSGELEGRLRTAHIDDGCLREGSELRAIRQMMMRLRSLDMVQQPLETPFLDKLRLECMQVLARLWRDEGLPVDRATVLGDWVWRNVAPAPLDWARTARVSPELKPLREAFGLHMSLLLQVGIVATGARQNAFRVWMESEVLAPLLAANAELLDGAVTLLKDAITRMVDEF